MVIIPLGYLLLNTSSNLPENIFHTEMAEQPSILLFGLASDEAYRATQVTSCTGGLLHRLFTLTSSKENFLLSLFVKLHIFFSHLCLDKDLQKIFAFLEIKQNFIFISLRRFFSVTLSRGRPLWALPSILLSEVRTFLPLINKAAITRLTLNIIIIYIKLLPT